MNHEEKLEIREWSMIEPGLLCEPEKVLGIEEEPCQSLRKGRPVNFNRRFQRE